MRGSSSKSMVTLTGAPLSGATWAALSPVTASADDSKAALASVSGTVSAGAAPAGSICAGSGPSGAVRRSKVAKSRSSILSSSDWEAALSAGVPAVWSKEPLELSKVAGCSEVLLWLELVMTKSDKRISTGRF